MLNNQTVTESKSSHPPPNTVSLRFKVGSVNGCHGSKESLEKGQLWEPEMSDFPLAIAGNDDN